MLTRVAGDVEGECALAKAWPGRQNDHVGALKAATQKLVDVAESGRDRREVGCVRAVKRGALLEKGIQDLAQVKERNPNRDG